MTTTATLYSGLRAAKHRWLRLAVDLRSLWLTRTLRRQGCTVAGTAECQGPGPLVENFGAISLAEGVRFWGRQFRVELHTAQNGRLEIGEHTLINQGTTIAAHRHVSIGAHCLIGEFVAIHDSGFHRLSPNAVVNVAPVRIGDNVWIGHRAIILPGVEIGAHAVVGAGAVVTRSIPPRQIVAGCPAKPLRSFTCADSWIRS